MCNFVRCVYKQVKNKKYFVHLVIQVVSVCYFLKNKAFLLIKSRLLLYLLVFYMVKQVGSNQLLIKYKLKAQIKNISMIKYTASLKNVGRV